jgi:mannose-6-phosphate isomerase
MLRPLKRILHLKNPVQEYAWGSRTALQALRGQPCAEDKPMAELWMGAHPMAPSKVLVDGEWKSLDELIKADPESILGKPVAEKFNNQLPFLFKILAADKPLSIQVHPNREQAQAGFKREESLGIPLNALHRNYKDENHKPELLCALTSFQALKGFRKIEDILFLMDKVACSSLSNELADLRKDPNEYGLKRFFTALMQMDKRRQGLVVGEAIRRAEKRAHENQAFNWMVELNKGYPGDIGIFSPVMLNLLQLNPGEAICLSAGELHTYLHGVGIELMANSDNVIRGGLTAKHIDVPELLKIVDFKTDPTKILTPVPHENCEEYYPSPAEEFMLSVISINREEPFISLKDRSVEILMCIEGEAVIKDSGDNEPLVLTRGTSVIVPALALNYGIEGTANIYKASVPL